MKNPSKVFPGEYGYTLLRRVPDGPVEVWRECDWVHVHTATEFLYAFQWAYERPKHQSTVSPCLLVLLVPQFTEQDAELRPMIKNQYSAQRRRIHAFAIQLVKAKLGPGPHRPQAIGVMAHPIGDYAINWLAQHGEMPTGIHIARATRPAVVV